MNGWALGCYIIQKIGRNGYQLTNEVERPWGWIEGHIKKIIIIQKTQILNIYIEQCSKMGMQTVLVHKYIVYNKTLRYTYSLFMMIV